MSNETRSFNEPVIYTSSIVYATESRSFLPTLRETYRRFKRARSIINLSWESLSTSRVWSKAHRSKRTSSIEVVRVFLFQGIVESTSRHPKPLSYPETLSRLNETLFDGFNRWPSRAPPPPLLADFSPKLVLINESGRRHGSIAMCCYPPRTTWEIRERYVTISNRI